MGLIQGMKISFLDDPPEVKLGNLWMGLMMTYSTKMMKLLPSILKRKSLETIVSCLSYKASAETFGLKPEGGSN